jgi:hypothetical protein
MGLTIHYQGQLLSEAALEEFVGVATAYAGARGWAAHPVKTGRKVLTRMLQPEDPEAAEYEEIYEGPVRGIYLLPDAQCEPLTFEFDRDLFMQDWCKTQFAGAGVHAEIVGLFREVEGLFEMLDVMDEAEFWELGDRGALEEAFREASAAIAEAAAETPGAAVGVLTPSGRILDVLMDT